MFFFFVFFFCGCQSSGSWSQISFNYYTGHTEKVEYDLPAFFQNFRPSVAQEIRQGQLQQHSGTH